MEMQSDLVKRSSAFVSEALLPLSSFYAFHNLEHTKGVVRAASIIGRASQLTAVQLETVTIAAWFHDVAYCHGARGHEERSASVAKKMLATWGVSSKMMEDVNWAILSTKLPQSPRCLIDMVLCDADLAHLGSKQYERYASKLKTEFERQGLEFKTEIAWRQFNSEFIKRHRYFTAYGKTILEGRKKINLRKFDKTLAHAAT
jgi:predicted metal-dependent HD superfamily phosphohydrolase